MNQKMQRKAETALEYSKECFFKMQEYGAESMSEHERNAADTFEELLHTSLSEIEIGAVLAHRKLTYPKEA